MVWVVIDVDKIVAWHEEKRVVRNYALCINTDYERKRLYTRKVHKRVVKELPNYEDLYLVRRGKTFIQSGYLDYEYDDYKVILSELFFTKDILNKYMKYEYLDKKEKKSFNIVLDCLQYTIDNLENSVPSLEDLQKVKSMVEEYKYHISDLETDDYDKY